MFARIRINRELNLLTLVIRSDQKGEIEVFRQRRRPRIFNPNLSCVTEPGRRLQFASDGEFSQDLSFLAGRVVIRDGQGGGLEADGIVVVVCL